MYSSQGEGAWRMALGALRQPHYLLYALRFARSLP